MPNDGKTVTVDRLLRRSTLQDHITIDELPMPEGSQKVELIKLRNSFTEFATEEEKQRAMEQAASPKAKQFPEHTVSAFLDGWGAALHSNGSEGDADLVWSADFQAALGARRNAR